MTTELPVESLASLYLRIEYGDTPAAVLGVNSYGTEAEIRDAYRGLALRIHPDKAPDDSLRELHTLLFQKAQSSYYTLLNERSVDPSAISPDTPRQLPETLAALHARNAAFKEALQKERSRATDVKKVNDAKAAKLKTRNEELTCVRAAREQAGELTRHNRVKKLTKETMSKFRGRSKLGLPYREENEASSYDESKCSEASDWEVEDDRLEKKDKVAARLLQKFRGPAQNKPTANTSTSITKPALDKRLVSNAEIKGRWDHSLLTSGTSGSVSLNEKAQRERNAAATTHKHLLALVNEANAVYHRPEDQHLHQDALEDAFAQIEDEIDVIAEEGLRMIDQDVRDQHLWIRVPLSLVRLLER